MTTSRTTPAAQPAFSCIQIVRRWRWSWHRCKPFRISATFWGDKRLTVQRGFHIWFGWWRLSCVYLSSALLGEVVRDLDRMYALALDASYEQHPPEIRERAKRAANEISEKWKARADSPNDQAQRPPRQATPSAKKGNELP